jgi:site-specific DNA-methyltransferase (adenine-specific)
VKPYYEDEDVQIFHGDCREILPHLEADVLVTDPPYGVNGGSGTLGKASRKTKYLSSFEDTEANVQTVIIPAIQTALSMVKRGAITPGTPCMWLYPRPDDVGALFQPATTGLNKWGRETTQPVLFYGKDPRAGITIKDKHFQNTARSQIDGHPCPKPLRVMLWLVERASLEGETILDPFMGSGTTLRAAKDLGRKAIGIELEERYCEIAAQRMGQEVFDIGSTPVGVAP